MEVVGQAEGKGVVRVNKQRLRRESRVKGEERAAHRHAVLQLRKDQAGTGVCAWACACARGLERVRVGLSVCACARVRVCVRVRVRVCVRVCACAWGAYARGRRHGLDAVGARIEARLLCADGGARGGKRPQRLDAQVGHLHANTLKRATWSEVQVDEEEGGGRASESRDGRRVNSLHRHSEDSIEQPPLS
eukprot:3139614-Pleurochrysis_carterae.AAC.1